MPITVPNSVKASAKINSAGGISGGFGFSNHVRNSTGDYTATFANQMPDTDYAANISLYNAFVSGGGQSSAFCAVYSRTTSGFSYRVLSYTGTTNTINYSDFDHSLSVTR